MLEQRAAAGGEDADDARAEDRAVHPEAGREFGRHDRRQGAARHLGDVQVDPPATRIGCFAHTRNLPAFLTLDDTLDAIESLTTLTALIGLIALMALTSSTD
ncbi:hypothetical protein A6P39_012740 [Streptomyces sp. FXJ1.172]|uniref:hypothetical protein n=1 Tax=Streptomyces sp. FXJ1.172 TaxID=710705 RepID=UPI0007CFE9D3|nr:hypothetical protein [Streptomyces sp. FXJ1.172]WEP00513.1 hypothetical protein A6P39_012740 [Streptomyces sp. FXJ1.172]